MKIVDGSKVFIKNKKLNKYLFFLRDNKSGIPNPNMWGALGGGIEKGETPIQALKREIAEESNIVIYDIKYLGSNKVEHFVKDTKHVITGYYFTALTDFELDEIELFEGQRLDFFTLEEAKKMKNIAPPILRAIDLYEKKLN